MFFRGCKLRFPMISCTFLHIFPDPKPLFVATAAASSQQPAVQVILMLHRVQFNIAGREAAAGVGTLKEAHTHTETHI